MNTEYRSFTPEIAENGHPPRPQSAGPLLLCSQAHSLFRSDVLESLMMCTARVTRTLTSWARAIGRCR